MLNNDGNRTDNHYDSGTLFKRCTDVHVMHVIYILVSDAIQNSAQLLLLTPPSGAHLLKLVHSATLLKETMSKQIQPLGYQIHWIQDVKLLEIPEPAQNLLENYAGLRSGESMAHVNRVVRIAHCPDCRYIADR